MTKNPLFIWKKIGFVVVLGLAGALWLFFRQTFAHVDILDQQGKVIKKIELKLTVYDPPLFRTKNTIATAGSQEPWWVANKILSEYSNSSYADAKEFISKRQIKLTNFDEAKHQSFNKKKQQYPNLFQPKGTYFYFITYKKEGELLGILVMNEFDHLTFYKHNYPGNGASLYQHEDGKWKTDILEKPSDLNWLPYLRLETLQKILQTKKIWLNKDGIGSAEPPKIR